MVLTVSFVLSPVTGLFCHRHPADNSAELDSSVGASGPHDFAVHLTRRSSCSAIGVHRIPARVRDDRASAPLWDETDSDIFLIWGKLEVDYFCKVGCSYYQLFVRQAVGYIPIRNYLSVRTAMVTQ